MADTSNAKPAHGTPQQTWTDAAAGTPTGADFLRRLYEQVVEASRRADPPGSSENEAASIRAQLRLTLSPEGLQYLLRKKRQIDDLEASPDVDAAQKDEEMLKVLHGFPVRSFFTLLSSLDSSVERLTIEGSQSTGLDSHPQHAVAAPLGLVSSLRVLELKNCNGVSVFGLSEHRRRLQKLTVTNCISSLPELLVECLNDQSSAAEWIRLRSFSCQGNTLTVMDSSLSLLRSVEVMDLSHNEFKYIEQLQNCTQLKYLNMGFNHIANLDHVNTELGNISTLILRQNRMVSLGSVCKLYSLVKLDLADNLVKSFNECKNLGSLPCLEALWLNGNPITFLEHYRERMIVILRHRITSVSQFLLDNAPVSDKDMQEALSFLEHSDSSTVVGSVGTVMSSSAHVDAQSFAGRSYSSRRGGADVSVSQAGTTVVPVKKKKGKTRKKRIVAIEQQDPNSNALHHPQETVHRQGEHAYEVAEEYAAKLAAERAAEATLGSSNGSAVPRDPSDYIASPHDAAARRQSDAGMAQLSKFAKASQERLGVTDFAQHIDALYKQMGPKWMTVLTEFQNSSATVEENGEDAEDDAFSDSEYSDASDDYDDEQSNSPRSKLVHDSTRDGMRSAANSQPTSRAASPMLNRTSRERKSRRKSRRNQVKPLSTAALATAAAAAAAAGLVPADNVENSEDRVVIPEPDIPPVVMRYLQSLGRLDLTDAQQKELDTVVGLTDDPGAFSAVPKDLRNLTPGEDHLLEDLLSSYECLVRRLPAGMTTAEQGTEASTPSMGAAELGDSGDKTADAKAADVNEDEVILSIDLRGFQELDARWGKCLSFQPLSQLASVKIDLIHTCLTLFWKKNTFADSATQSSGSLGASVDTTGENWDQVRYAVRSEDVLLELVELLSERMGVETETVGRSNTAETTEVQSTGDGKSTQQSSANASVSDHQNASVTSSLPALDDGDSSEEEQSQPAPKDVTAADEVGQQSGADANTDADAGADAGPTRPVVKTIDKGEVPRILQKRSSLTFALKQTKAVDPSNSKGKIAVLDDYYGANQQERKAQGSTQSKLPSEKMSAGMSSADRAKEDAIVRTQIESFCSWLDKESDEQSRSYVFHCRVHVLLDRDEPETERERVPRIGARPEQKGILMLSRTHVVFLTRKAVPKDEQKLDYPRSVSERFNVVFQCRLQSIHRIWIGFSLQYLQLDFHRNGVGGSPFDISRASDADVASLKGCVLMTREKELTHTIVSYLSDTVQNFGDPPIIESQDVQIIQRIQMEALGGVADNIRLYALLYSADSASSEDADSPVSLLVTDAFMVLCEEDFLQVDGKHSRFVVKALEPITELSHVVIRTHPSAEQIGQFSLFFGQKNVFMSQRSGNTAREWKLSSFSSPTIHRIQKQLSAHLPTAVSIPGGGD